MRGNHTTIQKLDRADTKILRVLGREGRITWSDLADRIGLSLTPTIRRVRKLEQSGVIRGYIADIDQTRLIGSMAVFMSITMERQVEDVLAVFETEVSKLSEIVGGYLMSGGNDYTLHAFVRDLEHYRQLLGVLTRINGIAHINSSFILKTFLRQGVPAMLEQDYTNAP